MNAVAFRAGQRAFACLSLLAILGTTVVSGQAADAVPAGAVPAEVEKALQLPKGDEQTKALSAAAAEWAKKEPTTALAWLSHVPRETPYAVSGAVIGACALSNGKAAADWMVQNGRAPGFVGLHILLVTWASRGDSASAAVWCAQAPKSARDTAFFSVGDGWYLKDQPAVCEWATKLESDDDRHSAIRGVALKWGRANIPAAGVWIKKLKQDEIKVGAKAIVDDWRANKFNKDKVRDDAAVKEWLAPFQLSDADKEELLKDPALANKTNGTQK